MFYAGIDIGGTRIKMGIVDEKGQIYHQCNEPTAMDHDELIHQINSFIQNSGFAVHGVGISTPGIVRDDGYMQTSGAIKCFFNRNMKAEMEAALRLPIHVENDGKCAASAEKWLGAAKNLSDFCVVTLGTAIGGAVYIHGKLYRGLGGIAGEFGVGLIGLGHDYKTMGMAFHAAAVAGLCRNYSYRVHEKVLDVKEILRRSKHGDEIALNCLNEFYHAVAILCVNLAVTIGPNQILIGGGISGSDEVMGEIRKAYDAICQEYHVLSLLEMPEILTCECKNDAGLLGAVYNFMMNE